MKVGGRRSGKQREKKWKSKHEGGEEDKGKRDVKSFFIHWKLLKTIQNWVQK